MGNAEPLHLARINNKNGHHVLAAAISADGSRIAFSDTHQTRVLHVNEASAASPSNRAPHSQLSFTRQQLREALPPAHHLSFGSKGSLALSASDGAVSILDLHSGVVSAKFPPPVRPPAGGGNGRMVAASLAAREALLPPLAALSVSPAGDMAAAAGGAAVHFYT